MTDLKKLVEQERVNAVRETELAIVNWLKTSQPTKSRSGSKRRENRRLRIGHAIASRIEAGEYRKSSTNESGERLTLGKTASWLIRRVFEVGHKTGWYDSPTSLIFFTIHPDTRSRALRALKDSDCLCELELGWIHHVPIDEPQDEKPTEGRDD